MDAYWIVGFLFRPPLHHVTMETGRYHRLSPTDKETHSDLQIETEFRPCTFIMVTNDRNIDFLHVANALSQQVRPCQSLTARPPVHARTRLKVINYLFRKHFWNILRGHTPSKVLYKKKKSRKYLLLRKANKSGRSTAHLVYLSPLPQKFTKVKQR